MRDRERFAWLDEALRVNIAIVTCEVDTQDLLVVLQALSYDFHVCLLQVVV